ncbi:hypothetical protein [Bradyrhizobium elkanii]|uniref:hypothetical protein n=1 Tax=Bradyrhizobium elkanii TaxID=29448 RepID=UPI00209E74EF|nr:hypothetical protein [Bradyrhizobium elkanii]MCP1973382.1 hypothetical protein [Bradyrhizobium elkanii]MCS4105111.1 hypothetical protein [Bradyrhizobium elkanii]MCW2126689.1 hypothetical protein [Bradyrhizobium elkanii]MCW2173436.1 hypothetical protein [Bradyrhizobium elkanii]
MPSQSNGFWLIPRQAHHLAQIPQRETLSPCFRFLVVFPAVGRRFVAFPAAHEALRCTKSASRWAAPSLIEANGAENAGYAFRAEDVSLR